MAGAKPQYKRSWKNLLLNKRYQLRFTLFMVGVSAVLMTGLGVWVMKEANEATTVAMARVRGEACPKIPEVIEVPGTTDEPAVPMNIEDAPPAAPEAPAEPPTDEKAAPVKDEKAAPAKDDKARDKAPAADEAAEDKPAEPKEAKPELSKVDPKHVAANNGQADLLAVKALWCTDAECKPETAAPLLIKVKKCDDYVKDKLANAEAVDALRKTSIPVVKCEGGGEPYSVADAEPERHATVQLEETSMTITPTLPTDFADRIVAHHTCEMRQAGSINALEQGRLRILWVLIGTGLLLMLGLALYGIKMTHKVAGPLFKVSLYFAKMRDGRLDKVYNLRKGDQLVDFYEHFKSAHAGVVTMEKDDLARIKATIEAADAAGLGDHASIAELRTLLARKEKSLE
ncbi:MAG TPA: hypothetical protein VFV99_28130 [Kofleriaceae bacterium]|nr:hypothetical protein [Kofleriaceae bacterium]